MIKRRRGIILFIAGTATALLIVYPYNKAVEYTSTNEFCFSCHSHDHAEESWRLSNHVNNKSGVTVGCAECHLPPKGEGYIKAKIKHGAKDLYGYLFKDPDEIDWEAKHPPHIADNFTYESSCLSCHDNLYPVGLSQEGIDSHIHYENNQDELSCLNCHSYTGHYNPDYVHAQNLTFGVEEPDREPFTEPAIIDSFANYTEQIPGTAVSFDMVAIPGGSFLLGSPKDEPFREKDEGPQVKVNIDDFYIAKVEVTWNEFLAWFNATSSEGRLTEDDLAEIDGFSGATPPWGAPDQGWGTGSRPAITMTHHAAMEYCRWLSEVTGKYYRLPTEAEWEYAARGNKETPYYFEGDPKKLTTQRWWNRIFGPDTTNIASHVIYKENSNNRTAKPEGMGENPFGLINMLGNVAEFCLDYYSPNTYSTYSDGVSNPVSPANQGERVIRGGSFQSDAAEVRVAARDYTKTEQWLRTDPQIPKSIWWYSDANHVGFRVVHDPDSTITVNY
ncbi:SUMF1/EgtB/PvdO family nonheme iron enzyme [Marinilabiliaceae bacterium ANBcel2]|nr:SUMF1/EgtB/PvdO family nonheme iron enzyme [Marinilabiliaceae bacterium ANBcel2]